MGRRENGGNSRIETTQGDASVPRFRGLRKCGTWPSGRDDRGRPRSRDGHSLLAIAPVVLRHRRRKVRSTADLVVRAREHRDDLVLKATLLHGGDGFVGGWLVSPQEWDERVAAAMDGPYVLQERVRPAPELFPAADGSLRPWVLTWGVFISSYGYAGAYAGGVTTRTSASSPVPPMRPAPASSTSRPRPPRPPRRRNRSSPSAPRVATRMIATGYTNRRPRSVPTCGDAARPRGWCTGSRSSVRFGGRVPRRALRSVRGARQAVSLPTASEDEPAPTDARG